MQIEGLITKSTCSGNVSENVFSLEGASAYRRISLKVTAKGAVAEFLEGRDRPGIENGELVPMAIYTPDIGDRIVRAMAKLHFGLDEAATGYTATDMDLIARGFTVGSAQEKQPIWICNAGTHFIVIGKTAEGGLPSSPADPCCLIFGVPKGRNVTVKADNLRAALKMLDSGQLPQLLNPLSNVEVEGAYLTDNETFH